MTKIQISALSEDAINKKQENIKEWLNYIRENYIWLRDLCYCRDKFKITNQFIDTTIYTYARILVEDLYSLTSEELIYLDDLSIYVFSVSDENRTKISNFRQKYTSMRNKRLCHLTETNIETVCKLQDIHNIISLFEGIVNYNGEMTDIQITSSYLEHVYMNLFINKNTAVAIKQ